MSRYDPINMNDLFDAHHSHDLSYVHDERADRLADLALSALRNAGGFEDQHPSLMIAQVYATLAHDQRTAALVAALPGYVDTLNDTLDGATGQVEACLRELGDRVDPPRRSWRQILRLALPSGGRLH